MLVYYEHSRTFYKPDVRINVKLTVIEHLLSELIYFFQICNILTL